MNVRKPRPKMKPFTFRRAVPEDVYQVVPLIHESSRKLLDTCFEWRAGDTEAFLILDYLRGRSLFGYENQFLALNAAGQVIGTMTLYPSNRLLSLNLKTLFTAWRYYSLIRLIKVIRSTLGVSRLFKKPNSRGIFMANVCIAPEYRGQGIFRQLFEYGLSQIRPVETCIVQADVSYDNDNALKVYKKINFIVVKETADNSALGLQGFRRIELVLRDRQAIL